MIASIKKARLRWEKIIPQSLKPIHDRQVGSPSQQAGAVEETTEQDFESENEH